MCKCKGKFEQERAVIDAAEKIVKRYEEGSHLFRRVGTSINFQMLVQAVKNYRTQTIPVALTNKLPG